MSAKLRERVVECLSSNLDTRFTARDIALWICEHHPELIARKQSNSAVIKNLEDMLGQLVAEISAKRTSWQRIHPELRTNESVRPRLYYWSASAQPLAELKPPPIPQLPLAQATPLVPPAPLFQSLDQQFADKLMQYLLAELDIRSIALEHHTTHPRDNWLLPDVVGMQDMKADCHEDVISLVNSSKARSLRHWSFQLCPLITLQNVREAYFQALSSCAWANKGYLVTTEIEGVEALAQIRTLGMRYGLGVIRLNLDAPLESVIVIPARENAEIDWEAASRMAHESRDFALHVRRARQFHLMGEFR